MNTFKIKYRSSSAYKQLLIAHIMSKTIFMKHLPLLDPNWSQNQKFSEFIEIWDI